MFGFQVLAIALVFFVALKQELVTIVKDFINALPVGSGFVESIAVRCYMLLTALSNSPSIIALCWVVLNVFVAYQTVRILVMFFHHIIDLLFARISEYSEKIVSYFRNQKGCYLINECFLN